MGGGQSAPAEAEEPVPVPAVKKKDSSGCCKPCSRRGDDDQIVPDRGVYGSYQLAGGPSTQGGQDFLVLDPQGLSIRENFGDNHASPRSILGNPTGPYLQEGDVFTANEQHIADDDANVRFLRLQDGRGWVRYDQSAKLEDHHFGLGSDYHHHDETTENPKRLHEVTHEHGEWLYLVVSPTGVPLRQKPVFASPPPPTSGGFFAKEAGLPQEGDVLPVSVRIVCENKIGTFVQ